MTVCAVFLRFRALYHQLIALVFDSTLLTISSVMFSEQHTSYDKPTPRPHPAHSQNWQLVLEASQLHGKLCYCSR